MDCYLLSSELDSADLEVLRPQKSAEGAAAFAVQAFAHTHPSVLVTEDAALGSVSRRPQNLSVSLLSGQAETSAPRESGSMGPGVQGHTG